MEDDAPQSGSSHWVLTMVLLLIPLWLPFAYLGLVALEMKFTKHGPLNEACLFLLFVAPAIGALPIIVARDFPVAGKILLVPMYYAMALSISFFLGWGFSTKLFGP